MPFGRLREPVSALGAADAVILDDGHPNGAPSAAAPPLTNVPADARQFSLRRSIGGVRALESHRPWPAGDKGPVVALSAIAQPDRFARALRAAGWQVAREISFRDHHAYTAEDVARLAVEAAAANATGVLTTEKDAERLLQWRPFPVRLAAVALEVSIEPHEAFRAWLLDRIHEARA
jgi:tetraacyldisaccharide 4'-kinase